jgi:signal recognition particle GTPase
MRVARGGAIQRAVVGVPVVYASTVEKLTEFVLFHSDRRALRILLG